MESSAMRLKTRLRGKPRTEPSGRRKAPHPDLDELLQGMKLRPKSSPLDPTAVRLLTIHAAKGLEFDRVWLIGMAKSVLPSWQSLKYNAQP